MYKLTEEGKKYLDEGLPEKNLLEILKKGKTTTEELKEKMQNPAVAINWARKQGWIKIKQGEIQVDKEPKEYPQQISLQKISKGEDLTKQKTEELLKRGLIEEIREDIVKQAQKQLEKEKINNLTPELIQTGLWKKANIKKYNIEAVGKKKYPGKKHVLSYYIEKVRKVFLEMGFEEEEGSYVESSFWNFDALYTPQDHPAREMHDTFFLKKPRKTKMKNKELVKRVKKIHEQGNNESKGWGYNWSEEEAQKLVMRTHTTPVTVRKLQEIEPPAKVFSVGRVFRNETLDYSHLPEFTQIEGIVASEKVNFKNLLGYLKEFYSKMGFEEVRFRPGYFPYTEMSVEPEVYVKEKDEWLELGGAGIFRPEVTEPMGIKEPVLAWGLGLERLAMMHLDLKDIRNFYYKNDLSLLREAKINI